MGRTVVSRYRPSAAPSIAVLIAYSRNAQGYSKFLASVRHSEPSLTHASDPAPIHDSKPTPTHATKSSPGASCQTHPTAAIAAAHATSTPGTGVPTHPLRKQSLRVHENGRDAAIEPTPVNSTAPTQNVGQPWRRGLGARSCALVDSEFTF